MFGYIMPSFSALSQEQKDRFRAAYCGLCKVLRQRYGLTGSATLSYDLTFLAILLDSLYEPKAHEGSERCPTHPLRPHPYVYSEPFEYAADMNFALAYHKCLDNWLDDRNVLSLAESKVLHHAYERAAARRPEQCRAIEAWLHEIHEIEASGKTEIDPPANSTGRMLGKLFRYKEDFWADSLERIGDGLGRFIYLMDAYDDLPQDLKHKSYNPLAEYHGREDFEAFCRDALTMAAADCTLEFEKLPIVQDADLLRNVLYSGIWSRYVQLNQKKNQEGAE